jgi:hypothetical protein
MFIFPVFYSPKAKGNEAQIGQIKAYRDKIEAELGKICEDILEVLDSHLIKSAESGESKVFYHKMLVIPFYFHSIHEHAHPSPPPSRTT